MKLKWSYKMVLNAETVKGISVVSLPERLNSTNCPAFKQFLDPLMAENALFVFDMTQLNYMDSSALGTMVGCIKHLREIGGDLKLFGMTKRVRALFEMVRMHHIFEIFDTREEALDSFSNGSAKVQE